MRKQGVRNTPACCVDCPEKIKVRNRNPYCRLYKGPCSDYTAVCSNFTVVVKLPVRDYKRLVAFSGYENIGSVAVELIGIGLNIREIDGHKDDAAS